jgi:glycosyltransferase involved in cell wall biosynthesis
MFEFRDRVVYIISPEQWGDMKISKHHYSLELADRGCRVFFIEPPSLDNRGISVRPCKDHPGIGLVSYKPVYRGKRLLPSGIFKLLLRWQIRLLRKSIGHPPDVVWCFHGYLFEDLKPFGAPVNIYFAADLFNYDHNPPEIDSATVTMAVSDTIHQRIAAAGHTVHLIKHGVSRPFAVSAERLLRERPQRVAGERVKAGFVGNLRMEAIDRVTVMNVIRDNPDVDFLFWGSYKSRDMNLGGLHSEEADAFIRFLEESGNVELRGVLDTAKLNEEMKMADFFWLCLQIGNRRMWDGSNSHKILEYLSTGKPIVAHFVSSYKDTDLLYMMPTTDNAGYPKLFREVVELIWKGEDPSKAEARLREAVSNTYSNHISRIEGIVRQGLG